MKLSTSKNIIAALGLSLCFGTTVHAENSQQNRMADCNAQASGKKGDEHKAFMSSCLSAKPAASAAAIADKTTPQQQRMKDCNASATGKKGDERKAFMSSCLSGKSATATPAAVAPAAIADKAAAPQQRMKDCNASAAGKKGDERKTFMSSCLKN